MAHRPWLALFCRKSWVLLHFHLWLRRKDMKKYYKRKQCLRQILINLKHITKPREEQERKEYVVLDLKEKITISQIILSLVDLMLHYQYYLRFLNKQQPICLSL